jgi:hypothetical protein
MRNLKSICNFSGANGCHKKESLSYISIAPNIANRPVAQSGKSGPQAPDKGGSCGASAQRTVGSSDNV